MKKAVIYTLVFNQENVGQRIQAFALEYFMKKHLDVDAKVLDFRNRRFETQGFRLFEDEHMHLLDVSKSMNPIKDFKPDFLIIGGDQVLNIRFKNGSYKTLFNIIQFARSSLPNIGMFTFATSDNGALSASGIKSEVFNLLNGARGISLREGTSVNNVQKMFKVPVRWDLDPVFLLTKDEWTSLMRKPDFIQDELPVSFTYSNEKKQNSHEIVDGWHQVKMYFNKTPNSTTKMSISPLEFLWLVGNSSRFSTCSYHGFVFSLILDNINVVRTQQLENLWSKDLRFMHLKNALGV